MHQGAKFLLIHERLTPHGFPGYATVGALEKRLGRMMMMCYNSANGEAQSLKKFMIIRIILFILLCL